MSTESAADRPAPAPAPGRRVVWVVALVAVLAYAVDLVTKIVAVSTLEGSPPVRVLGGLVYLQLVRNPGAAFGLATGMTWLFAVAAIVVAGAILWLARRLRSVGWAVGLGLVLAGALGNLTDRLFRAPSPLQGHVVDFISVFAPDGDTWPVFNVADSALSVGAVLIVLLTLLGRDYDGRSTRRGTEPDPAVADSAESTQDSEPTPADSESTEDARSARPGDGPGERG